MDRQFLAEVRIKVYAEVRVRTDAQPVLDQFNGRPWPLHGFDHYKYKDVMYNAYTDFEGEDCIFLDRPTFR